MCGLLAIFDPHGNAQHGLPRALETMRHRGPDGTGIWHSDSGTVALGHVRLAIIDPTTGTQPITNEDGSLVAIVNGEFYDHDAIRTQLEQRGHRFRTHSDSEILLHLYEEYGTGCLANLCGEFAFVLWDAIKQRFFAARDRFGIKPLYWCRSGRRLLFASEAKAFFACGVSAAWDRSALFQVCGMQYPLPHQSLFANIAQVPPAHHILAGPETFHLVRYWDIPFRTDEPATPDIIEQLRYELGEAVRLRLRADVPICFHLSGGLDSTTITALAKRHLAPVCYTVAFEQEGYDELAQAHETANELGVELRPVFADRTAMLNVLEEAVVRSEGLAINGHLPAKFLLAEAIRRDGFKVVLSGEGADEIFGGYAHLRQDLLEANGGDVAALHTANATMAGIQLPHGDGLPLQAIADSLGYVPTFLRAKASLGFRMRALLKREFLAEFAAVDPYRQFIACVDSPALRRMHRVNAASYLWSKSALANYILRTLGDGTEMAHGVEGRLPFLDHRLVSWAGSLPIESKIHDGEEKYLLRQAFADIVPHAVRTRRKNPFTAPPMLVQGHSELVEDYLSEATLRSSPFFDADQVSAYRHALRQQAPADHIAADPVLMLILTTQMMQARFGMM